MAQYHRQDTRERPVLAETLDKLEDINEWSDLYELLFKESSSSSPAASPPASVTLTNAQRSMILEETAAWLNEMRPSNSAVIKSLGMDYIEYHLYLSHELGDLDYFDAVEELLDRYSTLKEAYDDMTARGEVNAFTEKYSRYQGLIETKLRHIFLDAALPNQIFLSKNSLKPMDSFLTKYTPGFRAIPEEDHLDVEIKGIFEEFFVKFPGVMKDKEKGDFVKVYGQLTKEAKGDPKKNKLPDPVAQEIKDKVDAWRMAWRRPVETILKKVQETGYESLEPQEVETFKAWVTSFKKWKKVEGETFRHLAILLSAPCVSWYDENGMDSNEKLTAWARDIIAWKDAHIDTVTYLTRFFPKLAPRRGEPQDKDKGWKKVIKLAYVVKTSNENNVDFPIRSSSDLLVPSAKNIYNALSLHMLYKISSFYDAHTRTYPGQNVWRVSWATLQGRNPHIAVINPMMRIWSTSTWAFTATRIYSIAQENWTGDVQRGRREMLTAYGKELAQAQAAVVAFEPPGEDSASYIMLQAKAPEYTSTQRDWFMMQWGRPSLFGDSLAGTETRYAFNVSRFLMDMSQYEAMHNPKLGVDKKLSHISLWYHYFIGPFALLLLIFLPPAAPFSAFAFLKPALYWISISWFLMLAINKFDLVRHWRQTGSLWLGILFTARDVAVALPFYVSLLPQFVKGFWNAANERFRFIPSRKDAILSVWSREEIYEKVMQFDLFGKPFPFNSVVGILGLVSFTVGLCTMTAQGPLAIILYLFASIAFMTGPFCYGAFLDKHGNLKGIDLTQFYKALPWVIGRTCSDLTFNGRFLLGAAVGLILTPLFMNISVAAWLVGFASTIPVVAGLAWVIASIFTLWQMPFVVGLAKVKDLSIFKDAWNASAEKRVVYRKETQQKAVDAFVKDELSVISQDNLRDRSKDEPGLRTILSQDAKQDAVNAFVERTMPEEIIQAMTDVQGGKADVAKKALFEAAVTANREAQQKAVHAFVKDRLPAISLKELRDQSKDEPGLRALLGQGAPQDAVNAFVERTIPEEIILAMTDVQGGKADVAKKALFEAAVKASIDAFVKDELSVISQDNLRDRSKDEPGLRTILSQDAKQDAVNAFVERTMPEEIIQAMTDVQGGKADVAKKALFEAAWDHIRLIWKGGRLVPKDDSNTSSSRSPETASSPRC